jgi:hypothetical protein
MFPFIKPQNIGFLNNTCGTDSTSRKGVLYSRFCIFVSCIHNTGPFPSAIYRCLLSSLSYLATRLSFVSITRSSPSIFTQHVLP